MLALALLPLLATAALADHTITIVNGCSTAQPLYIGSLNGGQNPTSAAYTGAQPGTLAAGASFVATIPTSWNSQICYNSDGANCAAGASTSSQAEWNMDSGGLDYYDISNVQGYTGGIEIVPVNTSPYGGCGTLECTSADCACEEAYPVDTPSPSCNPVQACPSGDYTVTFLC
ncbi:hypothetical protein MNV49_003654 [Pseudohyphozyma bogoriensis]|nr:hypothetical protein MNV49_003654 [Pseudohyphozyma bogoriensis]